MAEDVQAPVDPPASEPERSTAAQATFRSMAMADLADVLRNETRSYQFPWTAGIFADCIASAENECWMVVLDDRPIGHGVLSHGAGEAHLLNVCIVRDHQGRGCGRQLVEHLLARSRARGAAVVYLEVRPSNRVALDLYASFGFREVGRRRDYYPSANGNEEACVMALVFT